LTDIRLSWRDNPGQDPAHLRVPSARACSGSRRRLGECWSDAASKDGHSEIMISPILEHPMCVVGVLAMNLFIPRDWHGRPFATLARAIGLEGKMIATTEGEAFKPAS
jgi:hypothetical protein